MFPGAHAKFRTKPAPFDRETDANARRCRLVPPGPPPGKSRPEIQILFLEHCFFMSPKAHAKFRPKPTSFRPPTKNYDSSKNQCLFLSLCFLSIRYI